MYMSLYKIKQPVEYSFLQWMNNYRDSGHWRDKERFLEFARTVCAHHATKWKRPEFLREKILGKGDRFIYRQKGERKTMKFA